MDNSEALFAGNLGHLMMMCNRRAWHPHRYGWRVRSLKCGKAYLKACEFIADGKSGIGSWAHFNNIEGKHQGPDAQALDLACVGGLNISLAA